jgi:alpha-beta hydrolase superfamily lysophospholipase
MGSFVARTVVADPQCAAIGLAGLVLSGTAGPAGALGAVGLILANLAIGLRGPIAPSAFLDKLASGGHAKLATGQAKPRTPFDWLSRDEAVVDAYIADPWCGNVLSASFFRDMVGGLAGLFTPDYARRFPRELPVLLYSGDCDPVGGMGKGVTAVCESYREWGVKDLSFKLFPGGRHEMHNETNRQEVYQLLSDWLAAHLPAKA